MSDEAKSIFMVQDEAGVLWQDSLALDRRSCMIKFAGQLLSRFSIDYMLASYVWSAAEKAGWRMIEIELSSDQIAEISKRNGR